MDVNLPLCATWKTTGITVAGHENTSSGVALDALRGPVGLYAARDGTLYVVDRGNDRVMKYTWNHGRNGTQIGDGTGSGPRQLNGPVSVAVDEEMNTVYISDYGNNRVQRWSGQGMDMSVETVIGELAQNPSDTRSVVETYDIQITPQSKDALYFSDLRNRRVMKWQLSVPSPEIMISGLQNPLGIHVDAQGDIHVAECERNRISRWSSGLLIGETRQGGLDCPSAVVVDGDGRMFIADTNNHRIVLWELNATQGVCLVGCSSARGKADNQLARPRDVIFDREGNLLVADTENNRVQRFDLFIDPQCGKSRHLFIHLFKLRIRIPSSN